MLAPCACRLHLLSRPLLAQESYSRHRGVKAQAASGEQESRPGSSDQPDLQPSAPPKRSFFEPGRSLGYTEEDSAGQSNVFAVEPSTYVGGGASSNAVLAGVAGVVAAGLVLFALLGRGGSPSPSAVGAGARAQLESAQLKLESTQLRSLSTYKEQFAR